MKLFGGKHAGSHSAPEPKPVEQKSAPPKAADRKERFLDSLSAFLNRGGWKKFRKPLIIIGCILLLALIVIIGYSIWEKPPETVQEGPIVVETPKPAVSEVPYIAPEETQEPEPEETPEPTPEPDPRKKDCYTFLLLAYDQIGANTDTIIVGRMDIANGTIDLVNVPRDTLVNVSWGVKKINTILASERNDIETFIAHLSKVIGFNVDCYAIADIQAVEKLVDCIGGIYYNVPRSMDYDDPSQNLHIHIPKGYQLLGGADAVKVLRFRVGNDGTGYANGDLGRINTQQDLLKSLAAQMLKLGNIPNMDQAIEIFQTYVRTDLTANNIAFFLREFLMMGQDGIRFHTMPGDGISIRGGSYYQLKPEETLLLINEYLNPFNEEVALEHLDLLQSQGSLGVVSTTGQSIPITSFYDFSTYVAPTANAAAPAAEESGE